MLRNLYIKNGFLFSPMRSCLNSAGPGLPRRTAAASASSSGLSATSSTALATTSNARLTNALNGSSSGVVRSWISFKLPTISIVGRVGMMSL